MKQYLTLLRKVLNEGTKKDDRTGTGTLSLFGEQMRFNLQKGFPLLTTKKLHTRSIFHELLWMLKGDTNIAYLKEHNVRIWDEWATETGDLGPLYGKQWRDFNSSTSSEEPGVDQIAWVIEEIKRNPTSRRLIVSAWNPQYIPDGLISPQENVEQGNMALAPCHCFFQFYVLPKAKHTLSDPANAGESKGTLSCQLYQRSADIFLGVPFNIASYALLTHMVAQVCDLEVGDFVHTFGDVHLYLNHLEQALTQLERTPGKLPTLKLNPEVKDIFNFKYEDIEVLDYVAEPSIKAPIAV